MADTKLTPSLRPTTPLAKKPTDTNTSTTARSLVNTSSTRPGMQGMEGFGGAPKATAGNGSLPPRSASPFAPRSALGDRIASASARPTTGARSPTQTTNTASTAKAQASTPASAFPVADGGLNIASNVQLHGHEGQVLDLKVSAELNQRLKNVAKDNPSLGHGIQRAFDRLSSGELKGQFSPDGAQAEFTLMLSNLGDERTVLSLTLDPASKTVTDARIGVNGDSAAHKAESERLRPKPQLADALGAPPIESWLQNQSRAVTAAS